MTMRVLIFGGAGMLGHKVWQVFRDRFDSCVTLRRAAGMPPPFDEARVISPVDAADVESTTRAFTAAQPDVVINCIGVTKHVAAGHDPIAALTVNALFPHRLGALCRESGARLIHVSTDCVFSGRKGAYTEADCPDANDLYGRTKLLGEVTTDRALTIRTSIIGRELHGATGLLEWLISRRGGRAEGHRHAMFSGMTTAALAAVLADVVDGHPGLTGLYHVAADPISKYDLLCRINDRLGLRIAIESSDALRIDRTLDAARFRESTHIAPPGWDRMIADLASDPTPYEEWRRAVVC